MATSTIDQRIRTVTTSGTTDSSGVIRGAMSVITPGSKNGDVILSVFLEKDSYSVYRHVDVQNYGERGYLLKFFDSDTPIASATVNYTVTYLSM